MRYLSERYAKVQSHNGTDICTLKRENPQSGDESGYRIDDPAYEGCVYDTVADAVGALEGGIQKQYEKDKENSYEKELVLCQVLLAQLEAEVKVYSKNCFMSEPEEGYEAEWKQANEKADLFYSIMYLVDREVHEKKIRCGDELLLMLMKTILNGDSGTVRYRKVRNGIEVEIFQRLFRQHREELFAKCFLRPDKDGTCSIERVKIFTDKDSCEDGIQTGPDIYFRKNRKKK